MPIEPYSLLYAPLSPLQWGRLPAVLLRQRGDDSAPGGLRDRELLALMRDQDSVGWSAAPVGWMHTWTRRNRAVEPIDTFRRLLVGKTWRYMRGDPGHHGCYSCGERRGHRARCSYNELQVLGIDALLPWTCLSCGDGWAVAAWWSAPAVPLMVPCPCGTPDLVPLWGPVGIRWAYAMKMLRTFDRTLANATKRTLAARAFERRALFGLPLEPCDARTLSELELE